MYFKKKKVKDPFVDSLIEFEEHHLLSNIEENCS